MTTSWVRRTMATLAGGTLALGALVGVGAPAAQADDQQASDGTLDWGVRASFRSYVTGSIAHGSITTGDGATTNADGAFRFPDGTGVVDPEAGTAELSFGGSVQFTGHDSGDGALLDITLSQLRVQADGDSGVLVADIRSRPFQGIDPQAPLPPYETHEDVAFVTLDLSGADLTPDQDGTIVATAAPSMLTAAGSAAFAGFYPAGDPFDPVSFGATVAPAAVGPVVTAHPSDMSVDAGEDADFTAAASGDPAPAVQWESSTDGSTWAAIDGATSSTLSIVGVTVEQDGRAYRAVFSNDAGQVTSDAAILTVTAPPVPVAEVEPSTDLPAEGAEVMVTGTGFSTAGSGVYVGVGPASAADNEDWFTNPSYYTGVQWVQVGADGSLSATLTFNAVFESAGAEADCIAVECGVYTFAAHGSADRSQDTYTPLSFAGAEEPTWEPEIELLTADGQPYTGGDVAAGDVLTVRGSGFDPESNATTTRPPIPAGVPAGVYIVFGRFADTWKPSEAAPSTARTVLDQKWALAAAALDQVPESFQDAIRAQWAELSPDGTFETTLTVETVDAIVGNYGVYTYAAGGAAPNSAQELFAPVAVEKAWQPTLEVLGADGQQLGAVAATGTTTVTVKGTGFDPDANTSTRPPVELGAPTGVYVVFGKFADVWKPSAGARSASRLVIDQKWAMPVDSFPPVFNPQYVELAADGSLETTLDLRAVDDGEGTYGIVTYAAGGALPNAEQELFYPVTFANAGTPTLTADPATDLESGDDVAVSGSGYAPSRALYVAVTPQGESGTANPSPFASSKRVVTAADGTFSVSLEDVQAQFTNEGVDVDCAEVDCYVASFSSPLEADNALVDFSQDRTQDAFVPLTFASGDEPEPEPTTFTVTTAHASVPAGGQQTVTVAGLDAGEPVTVALGTAAVSPAGAVADDAGAYALTFAVPAATPAGTVTVKATGVTAQRTGSTTFAVTAAPSPAPDGARGVTDGVLDWGIKESFRAYIEGNIAHGSITVSGGASRNADGTFRFSGGSGVVDPTAGTADLAFDGTVAFQGHDSLLQMTVTGVELVVNGTAGVVVADVTSRALDSGTVQSYPDVELADVDLTGKTLAPSTGGIVTVTGVPAVLTSAGVPAFADFYQAGEALDPLGFTVALDDADLPPVPPPGSSDACVTGRDTNGVPFAPGACPGVEVGEATASSATVAPGGTVTITAPDFQASDDGVEVWLFSTPQQMGATAADASGDVSYRLTVPIEIDGGVHTVVLVGTDGHRAEVEITIADEAAGDGLPKTGTDWALTALAGIMLVGVGAGTLSLTRRWRTR